MNSKTASIIAAFTATILVMALAPAIPFAQGQQKREDGRPVTVSCEEDDDGSTIHIHNKESGANVINHRQNDECPPGLLEPPETSEGTLACAVATDLTTLTVVTVDYTYIFVVPTSTVPEGFC
jgi:hypothetical protein